MERVHRKGPDVIEYSSVNEDGHPVEPYTLVSTYEDGRIEVQDTSPSNPFARARILGARPFAEMVRDGARTSYLERTRYGIDQGPRLDRRVRTR